MSTSLGQKEDYEALPNLDYFLWVEECLLADDGVVEGVYNGEGDGYIANVTVLIRPRPPALRRRHCDVVVVHGGIIVVRCHHVDINGGYVGGCYSFEDLIF